MFFLSLPPLLVCCLTLCLGAMLSVASVSAQDKLFFADKHVQEGKVTGMTGNSVLVNLITPSGAPGQMAFDLGLLSRVEAAPPANFAAGSAAFAAGEWDKALAVFKPITEQFRGLPTDWARQAFAMLGDIYIEKNDVVHADMAYNDFRKLYPGGTSLRFNLGQARIALARANPAAARRQLDPIVSAALKNPASFSRADGAAYGQAFYLLGQLQEKEGKPADALEDYLRTVTLYYQDAATTARAQQRADALRAANKGLSVP